MIVKLKLIIKTNLKSRKECKVKSSKNVVMT